MRTKSFFDFAENHVCYWTRWANTIQTRIKCLRALYQKLWFISWWNFDENGVFWWFQMPIFFEQSIQIIKVMWIMKDEHLRARPCVRCLHIWITVRFQIVNIWTATSEYLKVRLGFGPTNLASIIGRQKLLGFCWKSRMLLNTVSKHDTNENKVFQSSVSKVMVIS